LVALCGTKDRFDGSLPDQIALALDVVARRLAEGGRADHEDREALRALLRGLLTVRAKPFTGCWRSG
jgi:hypothetical protein